MDSVLASLFLAHSTGRLAQMGDMIGTCLAGLTDEQVWAREGTHENAVGNLVLHLCGNYQVGGHLQQHAGQIVFDTKRLTGRDLGLYRP